MSSSTSTPRPWLYLPIDVGVREIHAKTLLAAHASRQGLNVLMGKKSDVSANLRYMPPGIFVGFGAHQNFSKSYRRLQENGFKIVAMDEEGLLTFSPEMFKRFRLAKETLEQVDSIVTWGDYQADMVRSFMSENGLSRKLLVSGNPRFDVISRKFRKILDRDVAKIREKYGRFILVVSSFPSCNHFKGKTEYLSELVYKKIIQTEEDQIFYNRYFDVKEKAFGKFLAAIPELARTFPDRNIVVRPHPSENQAVWKDLEKQYPNIVSVCDGNIQPWILATDAVVHHFCATAMEAYACDIPSIAYRPDIDTIIETDLPYKCSFEARTLEQLVLALRDATENAGKNIMRCREGVKPYYETFIRNLDGVIASTQIATDFAEIAKDLPRQSFNALRLKTINGLKALLGRVDSDNSAYTKQKFGEYDLADIKLLLEDIAYCDAALGNVEVSKIGAACFWFRSKI